MPRARSSIVNVADTPYYHCISRCVRRAFLCGHDRFSGRSYEHRRKWVEDRLHILAEVFAIDVCAYAVMSNHLHVVVHINTEQAQRWSTAEVLERWHRIFQGTLLSREYARDSAVCSAAEQETIEACALVWRNRLSDISWFMRALNEPIARQANREDGCTGRFWEGRFTSQALLDEHALAACMAYVDLNPLRAGIARSPATSKYTSIKYRMQAQRANKTPKRLMPFADCAVHGHQTMRLPLHRQEYFELVHRAAEECGAVHPENDSTTSPPSILANLAQSIRHFSRRYGVVAGMQSSLSAYKTSKGLRRMCGVCLD